MISVTNVNDAQFSTRLLAQTTLRNVLGTKTLSEMLSERDAIASVSHLNQNYRPKNDLFKPHFLYVSEDECIVSS